MTMKTLVRVAATFAEIFRTNKQHAGPSAFERRLAPELRLRHPAAPSSAVGSRR
jgi:hypothetical protein